MISTQGCAIDRSEGLSIGNKCELYFQWENVVLGMASQVVWRDAAGKMGLKFLSVDKDTQKRLSDLCATLSRRPLVTRPSREGETRRPAAEPAPASPSACGPTVERPRRRVPRYMSELPARLANLATGATSSGTLITLSVLGACMEGLVLPEVGAQCELTADWRGQTLQIQGVVVWKGKNQVGIKLVSAAASAEQLLREICANLRLQPLAH